MKMNRGVGDEYRAKFPSSFCSSMAAVISLVA